MSTSSVETQGSAGSHAARPRRPSPTRRRRHLRRRRRGARPQPVRRQAGGVLGREAPDRRCRRDDRRGAPVRRRPERPARRGRGRRQPAAARPPRRRWGGRVRRVLMTGVSYMIPFVAAGGLLIALGFLFGGYEIMGPPATSPSTTPSSTCPTPTRSASTTPCSASGFFAYLGAVFFALGETAFTLPRPGVRRLHRLRHRRPARHRSRVRDGCPGDRPRRLRSPRRPVSSAASSAVSSPAWSRTGSPGARSPPWARGLMPVLVIPLGATLVERLHHDRRARPAAWQAHGGAERRPDPHERSRPRGPAGRRSSG